MQMKATWYQEPRRLWKRTFLSAPVFLLHVLKQGLGLRVKF